MQSHDLSLDAIDRDGAVAEAADAVSGDSRADFFRKAGAAAGGTLLASSVFGALPSHRPRCQRATWRSSSTR